MLTLRLGLGLVSCRVSTTRARLGLGKIENTQARARLGLGEIENAKARTRLGLGHAGLLLGSARARLKSWARSTPGESSNRIGLYVSVCMNHSTSNCMYVCMNVIVMFINVIVMFINVCV